MGRHLEYSDFGPGRDRIPHNYYQYTISTPHQLGGSGQGYGRICAHEVGHGQFIVYQVPLCTLWEGAFGLAS